MAEYHKYVFDVEKREFVGKFEEIYKAEQDKYFDNRQFFKPFNGRVYISGDHMLNWVYPYHCTYCINHFYHDMYDNKYFMRRL